MSFLLLSISTGVFAWRNGLHTIGTSHGTVGSNPISLYKGDYTKAIAADTMRDYYGSHDWIAESALELLYNLRSSHGFLSQLWDINNPDNLRFYYLYATELPDSFLLPSTFTTRCGFKFELKHFLTATAHNRLRFYDDPSSQFYKQLQDDSACQSANSLYNQIVLAFEDNDCQRAAAFIGALMHVISDATYYPHMLADARSLEYEYHVMHVTFKTWTDVRGVRSNEFFNLAEAKGKLTAADMFNPYQATLLAGKNTRFGSLIYQDAEFLDLCAPSTLDRQCWADVETGGWISMYQQHSWTHSMRPSVPYSTAKKYFDTVEHNLNQAVYYCATAINYILDFAGYTDCECGSSSSGQDNPPPPDRDGEGVKDGVQLTVEQFEGLFYFNLMGLMATAIAIALLNKVELLEEFIPI